MIIQIVLIFFGNVLLELAYLSTSAKDFILSSEIPHKKQRCEEHARKRHSYTCTFRSFLGSIMWTVENNRQWNITVQFLV